MALEMIWPSALINGAVILALGGALWRSNAHRLDRVQSSIDRKVEPNFCDLRHQGIGEDIAEIKAGQEKMARTLEEIRVHLARENGRRNAVEVKK